MHCFYKEGHPTYKYYDTYKSNTVIPSVGAWNNNRIGTQIPSQTLFNPIRGITPTDIGRLDGRIGNSCNVCRIHIRIGICVPTFYVTTALFPSVSSICRLLLVQDMQSHDDIATSDSVIRGGIPTSGAFIYEDYTRQNTCRFKILKDEVVSLGVSSLGITNAVPPALPSYNWPGNYTSIEWDITFPEPQEVRFKWTDATTPSDGTYDEIVTNSWFIVANCIASDLAPELVYYSRFFYTDS